jgi:glucokinase
MKNKTYKIGIDIGGTNMKAVLFDGEKVIKSYKLGTPKDSLDHLLIMLGALIEPLLEKAKKDKMKVSKVGLSVAGCHDFDKKIIACSPNLPFLNGINLGEKLEEKINLPVIMDNDANCFLLAEAKFGAVKKYKNSYGLIVSTGIGGAWFFDEKIYRKGGEPGAMLIDFTDLIILEKAYQKLNQNNSAILATEAYRGDVLAQKAYKEIGSLLGVSLANIVNLIAPEIIVIGGGATNSSDLFFPQIKKSMSEYISNPNSKKTKIVKSKLGEDAGSIGAALLINDK